MHKYGTLNYIYIQLSEIHVTAFYEWSKPFIFVIKTKSKD